MIGIVFQNWKKAPKFHWEWGRILAPPLNTHADVCKWARGLNVGLDLHVHPQCVQYASIEGSGMSWII